MEEKRNEEKNFLGCFDFSCDFKLHDWDGYAASPCQWLRSQGGIG
jgi:hypothetical protein